MKWAQFKKKLNINVPAGQGDELNCKKQQHFIISIKTIKNHTILSTYQELIRRTKQKKTYISSIIPVLSYTHVLKHL
jgi:hypothetical protein